MKSDGMGATLQGLIVTFVACMFGCSLLVGAVAAEKKEENQEGTKDEKGLPLRPQRKIEFTTDEGTWMSLDVSPDGKIIIFDLLGDIYTLPIQGGQAKLISGGMAFDSQPKFSPDGKRVAFLSDRDGSENLWIMYSDGREPKQLTTDPWSEFTSPAWTPDGEYVMVSRFISGTYELWMYHIQGGAGIQVTNVNPMSTTPLGERRNALGVIASADGKYVYYAERTRASTACNAALVPWHVVRLDRKTGDEDVLIGNLESSFRPVLSPDGHKLVYLTRHETKTGMRLRNLETGEDRWLKYPITRDDLESRFTRDLFPGYAFLPNGDEIVYTNDGKIYRLNIAKGDEKLIPFSAQVSLDVGPKLDFPQHVEEGPVKVRLMQSPVQSPDGKELAFSALTHLYIMNISDVTRGKPQRLTKSDAREFEPTWSPDGKWIAYVTWSASNGGHIWKVPAAGGTPEQLTQVAAFYSDPVWSPDGTRIVALRNGAYDRKNSEFEFGQLSGTDMVWLSSDGGPTNLIIPAHGAAKPHFTHEKDRIYVYTPAGLMSLRYDGTDRHTHLQVKGQGLLPLSVAADDVRINPDGNWVLAHVMNQLYLIPVPMAGGGPPTINVVSPSVAVRRLTDIGADYFAWADDGKTITWAVGASFFREPLSPIQSERPAEKREADEKDRQTEKRREKFKEQDKDIQEIAMKLQVPRKTPKGTIVLRGATVITMRNNEVINNSDIVIENNRIKSVGVRGSVPTGARVFDVKNKTIVPGFIDTHAHWLEIRRGILDTENWDFLANLAYGVTAGLDVQTRTNDMFSYEDLVDAGEIIGLRAFSTGPGLFAINNNFQSLQEVVGVLTKYRKFYGTRNIKSYIVGNRRQRQLMVEASKELEMMPTTEGAMDMKLDLTHLIDGFHGNEHALPIMPLYKDVIEVFAKSGIGETPTLIINYGGPFGENYWYENTDVHNNTKLNHFTPHSIIDEKTNRRDGWFRKDEYAFPKFAAQMAKLVRAGGLVGVGSHGNLQGLGYHWEMWMLASGGMTFMEVLRCATINGAKIIGRPYDLGSIEPGKLADLVILDKNPLDDIHNTNSIYWVMKNGELYEGDTLNEIWPEQKKLESLWFWDYDQLNESSPLSHVKAMDP